MCLIQSLREKKRTECSRFYEWADKNRMSMKTESKTVLRRRHAHNSLRPISFYCAAPNAKSVYITGDFNRWMRMGMQRRSDGLWYVQISLCYGHYQYRFIVDGRRKLDTSASGVGLDEHGKEVSLVWVR